MHDHLYEHQSHLEDDDLRRHAEELELDVETLTRSLRSTVMPRACVRIS
jgi:hypothetical protein